MDHTQNIRAVLEDATQQQYEQGMAWYREANATALELALLHRITARQAAGVLAALSPRNSWGSNVSLARHVLTQWRQGDPLTGYLGLGLRKVERILAFEDVETVLNGLKVRAFFACIHTAGETDAICVDRHAHAVAWNHRDSTAVITAAGTRRITAAYQQVASESGVFGAQVQAITWIVWRSRYWQPGAWDGPATFGLSITP